MSWVLRLQLWRFGYINCSCTDVNNSSKFQCFLHTYLCLPIPELPWYFVFKRTWPQKVFLIIRQAWALLQQVILCSKSSKKILESAEWGNQFAKVITICTYVSTILKNYIFYFDCQIQLAKAIKPLKFCNHKIKSISLRT